MGRKKLIGKKACGWLLALFMIALNNSGPIQELGRVPGSMDISLGQIKSMKFMLPITVEIEDEAEAVRSSMDETLSEKGVEADSGQAIDGQTNVSLKVLNIPIKTVAVNLVPERILIPGGQNIGVALRTKGVLVVGTSDITASGNGQSPLRLAGIVAGDRIEKVNGISVTSIQHLGELVARFGKEPITLSMAHDKKGVWSVKVSAVKDPNDGVYRLGAWVRDSTAGVGTISFYDTASGKYGALGHAITDSDTGQILTIGEGEIMHSQVVDIQKGLKGEPGEMKGIFLTKRKTMGNIEMNNNFGIYGRYNEYEINPLYPDGLPIASRNIVREGRASILTTLDEGGVKEYACNITNIYKQDKASPRSMTIRITDEELLKRTGGIVQGMSGSPIIQDGRIVGAVTHVFVNDPTQGYGVFIEWMLEQCS